MYKTYIHQLGPESVPVDSKLNEFANKGFGLIGAPLYLPVIGTPGALLYTFADLNESGEASGEAAEPLPKPQIIPRDPAKESQDAEAEAHFQARRSAQGE